MSSARPRIFFDTDGICNACINSKEKNDIDWDARKKEFFDYVRRYKPKKGPYDCVLPWSGGKDSSAIAYKLKFELGLNPLLVTASPLIPNEIAFHNREEMLRLGFDHIMVRPNQRISRHLAKRFFTERGNPKVHWEASKESIPIRIAVQYGIPLVFYAEHGESEYGGRVLSEDSKKIKDFTEVLEHLVGDDANNWVDEVVTHRDLDCYKYPDASEVEAVGVKALYFSYFFRWSMYENYQYIKNKINFATAPFGRTDGTFTNFDSLDDKIDTLYYHMQYVKFGFGRALRDASRLIQNGHLSRQHGLDFVKKYDHEAPRIYLAEQLEYLGLDEAGLNDIINLHRNKEIWTQEHDQVGWTLKNIPI
jgi:N-acetyl sugar amidotransferase